MIGAVFDVECCYLIIGEIILRFLYGKYTIFSFVVWEDNGNIRQLRFNSRYREFRFGFSEIWRYIC